MEELVAEMGSAFVAGTGWSGEVRYLVGCPVESVDDEAGLGCVLATEPVAVLSDG